jgi:hypothetical protein
LGMSQGHRPKLTMDGVVLTSMETHLSKSMQRQRR